MGVGGHRHTPVCVYVFEKLNIPESLDTYPDFCFFVFFLHELLFLGTDVAPEKQTGICDL